MISTTRSENLLNLLSRVLLDNEYRKAFSVRDSDTSDGLRSLSFSHHVVIRAFRKLREAATQADDRVAADWLATEISKEEARIHNAVSFLDAIVRTLNDKGCPAIVIKSLDHWPDLGSDLDLYTNSTSGDVIRIMRENFGAQLHPRSWGDRLAHKWNFMVPGLPEAVEVHMGRLGQTGEHVALARDLINRARRVQFGDYLFPVASAEDRLIISTLQRMYRHFYFRLCDMVDTVELVESGIVDYGALHRLAEAAGIWEGVATYLLIVSDYLARYREKGLDLPSHILACARFGGNRLSYARGFLRIPILPHSARLYVSELQKLIVNGRLNGSLRLSLLPCLATAAAVEYKISGNDKGIW